MHMRMKDEGGGMSNDICLAALCPLVQIKFSMTLWYSGEKKAIVA